MRLGFVHFSSRVWAATLLLCLPVCPQSRDVGHGSAASSIGRGEQSREVSSQLANDERLEPYRQQIKAAGLDVTKLKRDYRRFGAVPGMTLNRFLATELSAATLKANSTKVLQAVASGEELIPALRRVKPQVSEEIVKSAVNTANQNLLKFNLQ